MGKGKQLNCDEVLILKDVNGNLVMVSKDEFTKTMMQDLVTLFGMGPEAILATHRGLMRAGLGLNPDGAKVEGFFKEVFGWYEKGRKEGIKQGKISSAHD